MGKNNNKKRNKKNKIKNKKERTVCLEMASVETVSWSPILKN